MKKFIFASLLLTGFGMTAGEPATSAQGGFLSSGNTGDLPVRQKHSRNILKVDNNSSLFQLMKEEDREAHGPGMFMNLGIFLPNQDYMDPYYVPEWGLYKTGYIFEVGNYFRFLNTDRFGLGLRATWIQLGYTTHADTAYSEGNAFGSPVRLGPQASYLINDVMGIDVYYQIGAQYHMDWYGGENMSFLGVTHEIGAAYRFMMFTAGVGLKFGKLTHIDNSDPTFTYLDTEKYSAGCLRVFLGIQL